MNLRVYNLRLLVTSLFCYKLLYKFFKKTLFFFVIDARLFFILFVPNLYLHISPHYNTFSHVMIISIGFDSLNIHRLQCF